MISDQHSETSNDNVVNPPRGLTVEESFFLELLQKKEKPVINLKFTQKGVKVGNLEPFSNYYSEAEIIRLLDSLVSKKALIKHEKGTVILCPKCGGHANMAVLVCPRCNSTKIGRKEELNHVECEYWGPREEFIDGVLLRCPRCDELLDERAIEGTSGYFSVSDPYFECQDCGTAVSKNNLTLVCIKCSNKYTTVQASYLNSVSYTLAQGVSVKPQSEPPKSIQQRMKEKYTPEPVVEKEPAPELEPVQEPIPVEEKIEEKPESEEEPEKLPESPEEPEKIELEVLPEPEVEPELVVEPEPEIIPEAVTNKKKKKSGLQNPMNRLSEMFKKKSKKKPTKKKSIKKTSIKKKINLEPLPEPEPEEEYESDEVEYEEEYIPENRFYEETPKPMASEINDSYQVLMVVENVTVSEFVIESLERVKKPINVLHMEDGALALKELKHKYDVLILDFDMKSFESKFMLSEMEKWGIMTPIIVLSDEDLKLEKYILNIETVLKKKQKSINKIGKILQNLL